MVRQVDVVPLVHVYLKKTHKSTVVRQVDVVPLVHVYLKKTQWNINKSKVVRQVDVVPLIHVYLKKNTMKYQQEYSGTSGGCGTTRPRLSEKILIARCLLKRDVVQWLERGAFPMSLPAVRFRIPLGAEFSEKYHVYPLSILGYC